MKIKTLAVIVISALSFSSAATFADDPAPATPAQTNLVNGGAVHFKGEVVNAACAVDAGSLDQTVTLGQVRASSLAASGATSSSVGFNIKLSGCDTTVSNTVAIAFTGNVIDSANPTVLALQGSAGAASNVGVQILDSSGTALALSGSGFSAATTLNKGVNNIALQARYYATGVATAGAANADATFRVQYQ